MGQSSNVAATMVALTKLEKEEYASGMGQWRNDAVMKDAQIKLDLEEYALSTGQSGQYAVERDAQSSFKWKGVYETRGKGEGQTVQQ